MVSKRQLGEHLLFFFRTEIAVDVEDFLDLWHCLPIHHVCHFLASDHEQSLHIQEIRSLKAVVTWKLITHGLLQHHQ